MAKKKNALEALRRYFQPTEKTRLRDVLREMPRAALDVAKEIPKEISQSVIFSYFFI